VRHATVRYLGVLVVLHVHADMTLIRYKVKVNFRKLAKPCMRVGGDDHQPPSGAFWFQCEFKFQWEALKTSGDAGETH